MKVVVVGFPNSSAFRNKLTTIENILKVNKYDSGDGLPIGAGELRESDVDEPLHLAKKYFFYEYLYISENYAEKFKQIINLNPPMVCVYGIHSDIAQKNSRGWDCYTYLNLLKLATTKPTQSCNCSSRDLFNFGCRCKKP